MADSQALRSRRYRAHRQGDHSLCKGECGPRLSVLPSLGDPEAVEALREAVLEEFAGADALSRGLALRLAELSALNGPAAVAALRALGELVNAQRGGAPQAARIVERRIS